TNNTADSITLSTEAAGLGVDGLLLVAPYYNKPPQEGLYRHFRAIAEASQVPCMIYNVPPRTSWNIEAATTLRLARDVPNIVAVQRARERHPGAGGGRVRPHREVGTPGACGATGHEGPRVGLTPRACPPARAPAPPPVGTAPDMGAPRVSGEMSERTGRDVVV